MDYRRKGGRTGPDGVGFDRENLFRIARELLSDGVGIGAEVRTVVAGPCERLGIDADGLYAQLRRAQTRVKVDRDTDAMAAAMAVADTVVGRFAAAVARAMGDPDPPQMYARTAALAWELGRRSGGRAFPFPSARLAAWLDKHRNTIDDVVAELESLGWIAVVRDQNGKTKFDSRRGKSREVFYCGPEPR